MTNHKNPPNVTRRILIVCAFTAYALALATAMGLLWPASRGDLGQVWAGAVALRTGLDPYTVIGPDQSFFTWPWKLFYPLTSVIVLLPLSFLSSKVAMLLFTVIGAATLAIALTRERLNNPQLVVFLSWNYLLAVVLAQWSPLLTGAALLPGLGGLLVCKPPIGLALWAGWPKRSSVIGGLALTGLSLVVYPGWPLAWLHAIATQQHMVAPVTAPGGFLILLALLQWRRPEARLLVVFACLPHTVSPSDAIPLWLVVQTWPEALIMLVASWVNAFVAPISAQDVVGAANWSTWLFYLPCTAMLVLRPEAVDQLRRFRTKVVHARWLAVWRFVN